MANDAAAYLTIASDRLTASINPFGAELSSLRDTADREYMTNADPAFWTGRAPLLFPIVGQLNGDIFRLDGRAFTMLKHGFARKSEFSVIRHDVNRATFRLTDSEQTRAQYPFAFELDADFALDGMTLAMTVTVRNPGDRPLPASFGYHPAFAWPLPGSERADHLVVFERLEPEALSKLSKDGVIEPEPRPTPVEGAHLPVTDALFVDDALIWKALNSRRLTYGAPGGPKLHIEFPDTPSLGIWTKPGAHYLCIEPWAGYADPQGFSGDFREKPGIMEIESGNSVDFRMTVTVRP
ncbi:MAG: aldose 1-epimerase family protein [Sphingomonadales bacterium]